VQLQTLIFYEFLQFVTAQLLSHAHDCVAFNPRTQQTRLLPCRFCALLTFWFVSCMPAAAMLRLTFAALCWSIPRHSAWASAEIFPGGWQSRHFAYPFQVVDDAAHMDVHKTLYPFNTTKKMPQVTATVPNNALRWEQGFFFTHAFFDTLGNYVAKCYQQLLSRIITC